MRVDFQAYPYAEKVKFTCSICGKSNRAKTFRVECTLNQFNREATTPDEVRAQSKRKAKDQAQLFLNEPVCATCEGAMTYTERRALSDRRKNR